MVATITSPLLGRLAAALAGLAPQGLVAAWVFGSVAEEREHRESDVDVAVLFDRGLDARCRFEARLRLAAALPATIGGRPVDVVVLNDAPPLFARRIVHEGRLLLCRDTAAEHAFRRDVQLRAADLAPFLRKMARLKLEALAR